MDGINFNIHTNDLFENGNIESRVKPADPDALADDVIIPKYMELYGQYI